MRVEKQTTIDAPREEVWELIADPAGYEGIWAGLTQIEAEKPRQVPDSNGSDGDGRARKGSKSGKKAEKDSGGAEEDEEREAREAGKGSRYQMRMRVGSADIGGLVEIVEYDPPGDMAWTGVTGIDQRGRWRLRETEDGRTRVTLRLSYDAPGGVLGLLADRFSAPMVAGNLEGTLQNVKRQLEGGPVSGSGRGLTQEIAYQAGSVKVLIESGIIRPIRPDRLARIGLTMVRWGRSPAAGYISGAVRFPDEPAIIDELGTETFSEVHRRTNALAHSFSDAGIKEGDGVGVMCRNHRGFIEATVALSKLGAHALYLNTSFAGPQLTEVVKREKPVGIVFDEEFTELLEDAATRRKRFIAWHEDPDALDDPTLDDLIAAGPAEDPVPPENEGRAIILTSGTTGTPKGASRGGPQSLDPAVSLLSRIPLKARHTAHVAAPLFHSWGFAHFSLGLILGSTLVLRRKFDPEASLAEIAKHKAESLVVVPVMMQRILELPEETIAKYDTSSLVAVCASGSALPGDLAVKWMDTFGDNLYNLYGSTEVAWATIATPADMRAAPGTAGKPPRGTVLKLYDDQGVEVPTGDTGRIFVGNDMLFEGYTGGGSKDEIGGLMATGDVGRLDDAGRLFVEGRDDEMIVSGGENLFPKEVEDTISRHPGVADVACIGVDDEKFGQRLRAFVVRKGSGKVSEDEIKQHVKSNLANFKVPREVWFIDELPRNATGKVLKRELKEMEKEPSAK